MEDTLIEVFEKLGEEYEPVRARMMKPERIQKFLVIFSQDDSYSNLMNAMESNDRETAFRAAHTLKGTAREVGLTTLGDAASEVCETLRPESGAGIEEARVMIPRVTELYNDAIEIIKDNLT